MKTNLKDIAKRLLKTIRILRLAHGHSVSERSAPCSTAKHSHIPKVTGLSKEDSLPLECKEQESHPIEFPSVWCVIVCVCVYAFLFFTPSLSFFCSSHPTDNSNQPYIQTCNCNNHLDLAEFQLHTHLLGHLVGHYLTCLSFLICKTLKLTA